MHTSFEIGAECSTAYNSLISFACKGAREGGSKSVYPFCTPTTNCQPPLPSAPLQNTHPANICKCATGHRDGSARRHEASCRSKHAARNAWGHCGSKCTRHIDNCIIASSIPPSPIQSLDRSNNLRPPPCFRPSTPIPIIQQNPTPPPATTQL